MAKIKTGLEKMLENAKPKERFSFQAPDGGTSVSDELPPSLGLEEAGDFIFAVYDETRDTTVKKKPRRIALFHGAADEKSAYGGFVAASGEGERKTDSLAAGEVMAVWLGAQADKLLSKVPAGAKVLLRRSGATVELDGGRRLEVYSVTTY